MNSQSELPTGGKKKSHCRIPQFLWYTPELPDVLDDHADNRVMSQKSQVTCLILKWKLPLLS